MSREITNPAPRRGSRILGIGSRRPDRVVTNTELSERLDTDDEWIQQRVGIIERRFAADDESVVDMAIRAGAAALKDSGVSPEEIDAVIVPNCTMTAQIPNAAGRVAHALGVLDAGAFDVNAGCAGFCYGLGMASDLVRAGTARNVLVIASEKLTDVIDPTDRRTAIIFADGAGAAVIGPSTHPEIGPVVWGHAGGRADVLTMREGYVEQDGATIFRWASRQLPIIILDAVSRAGLQPADIDVVVTHQANLRIIRGVERALQAEGFRSDVVVADDIKYSGNTSAASIPLALDALRLDSRIRSGDVVVVASVGAGLAFAGQVFVCP